MKKLLVRAPQWLGDAVVSTVFISRLKKRFPDHSISVLCPEPLADIFNSHPGVQSTITYRRSQNIVSVVRLLRNQDYETAYVLPRSFRTALEARLAGIPRRIGFSGDFRRFLLTRSVPYDGELAYPRRYLKLIEDENIPIAGLPPHFPSVSPSGAHAGVADFFTQAKRPVLGIAPASIAPSRTWESEKFAAVASLFQQKTGGSVVLFGSSNERAVTARVKEKLSGPVLDTAGNLTLAELGWAVKSCDGMLVNDSGLMHVASCFQIPTVVLFGASDPTWALPPWGKFTPIQHKEIWCVPCLKNTCVRFGEGRNECLKTISAGEVWNALRTNFGV